MGTCPLTAMRVRAVAPERRPVRPIVLATIAFVLLASTRVAAQPFTDASAPPVADPGVGEGVAWIDIDGDGDLDLTLSNESQTLRLFRNNGNGTFTDATPAALAVGGNWTGIAWGDYDNDGDPDLYAAEALRPKHLFRNNGDGTFTDVTPPALISSEHAHGVAWADYDRDGFLDLYVSQAEGAPKRLYRNLGGSDFVETTTPVMLTDLQYGRGATWGDVDDDGDLDLYQGNFGINALYYNQGDGSFLKSTDPQVGIGSHTGGVEFADYDNDGDLDLFVANGYSAPCRMLRNDAGDWVDASTGPLFQPGRCIGMTWGDVDNDGDVDLFIAKINDGNALLRNEGAGVFTDITTPVLADSAGANVGAEFGDYDNDGDLDIFVADNTGPDKLFRNDLASGNHWIELDLKGTVSNRSAIGARVRAVAGGVRQIREVSGGGGYNSQPTMRLHFGLGAATLIDTLTVRWPVGLVERLLRVAVDQRLTLVEGTHTGVDPRPVTARALRLSIAPNPARNGAHLSIELPETADLAVLVHDLQGRIVRALPSRPGAEPGAHDVTWDGRNDAGARVRPGVYLVVASAGTQRAQQRVAVIE